MTLTITQDTSHTNNLSSLREGDAFLNEDNILCIVLQILQKEERAIVLRFYSTETETGVAMYLSSKVTPVKLKNIVWKLKVRK